MSPAPRAPAAPLPLELQGLGVRYPTGQQALQNASLSLQGGTICALVGMNGSGKSTLFKAIMGFVRPQSGRVAINGQPIAAALRQQLVAYVPQAEEVDWQFPVSVADVAMMGRYGAMNFLRQPRAADRAAVADSLHRLGLTEFRDRQIGELSGGQKKRVFLARALAQGGRLLLLDEPFTGVDLHTEEAIMQLLRELRAAGAIILVSTHNLGSVPQFCDQVALIKGTVVACGPTADVFTETNLQATFGEALRQSRPAPAFSPSTGAPSAHWLSDGERPAAFLQDGHLAEPTPNPEPPTPAP